MSVAAAWRIRRLLVSHVIQSDWLTFGLLWYSININHLCFYNLCVFRHTLPHCSSQFTIVASSATNTTTTHFHPTNQTSRPHPPAQAPTSQTPALLLRHLFAPPTNQTQAQPPRPPTPPSAHHRINQHRATCITRPHTAPPPTCPPLRLTYPLHRYTSRLMYVFMHAC
jgi:hypothetical protein